MDFAVTVYANLLRAGLGIAAIYHVYKKQYKLIVPVACVFALTYGPWAVRYWLGWQMDPVGNILFLTIIPMSLYLGSSLKFYDRYAWWDYLVHYLSGCLFVCAGVALAVSAVGRETVAWWQILFFSFTFSLSVQILWEILEYLTDCAFHTDAQRWQKHSASHNHKPAWARQPAGLVDTMNDILISILGTLTACTAWWFAG